MKYKVFWIGSVNNDVYVIHGGFTPELLKYCSGCCYPGQKDQFGDQKCFESRLFFVDKMD
jgi:hypothetical protein